MAPQEYRPGKKNVSAAVVTVAATYVYFLLFAQFGFLKAAQAAVGAAETIKPLMAVMGLGGVAGSVLAAWLYAVGRSRRLLTAGFAGCAAAAGLSLATTSVGLFYGVALLVGLSTGFTTVTVASSLRRSLGGERLGTVIGLGTGLAYAFCNLPPVFQAGAGPQALLALLAAGAGAVGAGVLTFAAPARQPTGYDYSGPGLAGWVVVFLALVCLDSAAFYIIQHTPALKTDTWTGSGRLEMNAVMHLVAALLAGYALDRRRVARTVLMATVALLVACVLIDESYHAFAEGALLYTAGVSIYSTALVFYPARSLRPWVAALVYAVAGWGGSALGIGLAENQHHVPVALLATAGLLVGGILLARHFIRRRSPEYRNQRAG